jgi:hypothetical protein
MNNIGLKSWGKAAGRKSCHSLQWNALRAYSTIFVCRSFIRIVKIIIPTVPKNIEKCLNDYIFPLDNEKQSPDRRRTVLSSE